MALTQQDKEEMFQYLVSRGKSLGSLPEGDSNLSNKYLAPVLEYSGGTASKAVRLAVSLLQGKPAILRKSGDLVQWQLQGASTWDTLYSIWDYKGTDGSNGKNPVFRKNTETLEYKLDGEDDTAYKLLVALADITGPQGDHVVLRVHAGKLEYKQSKAADSTYQQLLIIEDMRGPQGRPGKNFQILGYYDTIANLRTAVPSPEPGEAYGIGATAPYPIYIWDGVSQDWVNNGMLQGPQGLAGKSARVNKSTGYWQEYDDDTKSWKDTEYIVQYTAATTDKDGLLSKEDKKYLDEIKSKGVEISKEKVEQVFTGNILTHTHDSVAGGMSDVWDGSVSTSFASGSGTEADPYIIATGGQLAYMRQLVNTGAQVIGAYYKMSANIDLNHIKWEPIGNFENLFVGCFDGDGHCVKNLNMAYKTSDSYFSEFISAQNFLALGFFLGTGVTQQFTPAFKNFGIEKGIVSLDFDINGIDIAFISVGGLIGIYQGEFTSNNILKISNCYVNLDITVTWTNESELMGYYTIAGGIVGFDPDLSNSVKNGILLAENSYFKGSVNVTSCCLGNMACGIGYTTMVNCYTSSILSSKISLPELSETAFTANIPIFFEASNEEIVSYDNFNSFYNKDLSDIESSSPDMDEDIIRLKSFGKTSAEMINQEFVNQLNGAGSAFTLKPGKNDGFPVLSVEKEGERFDGYVRESVFNQTISDLRALIQTK